MSKRPLNEVIHAQPFTRNHVHIKGENAHFVENLSALLGIPRTEAIRLYCVISEAAFITLASGHEVRLLNTGRIWFRHRPWAKVHRPTGRPSPNKSGYKTYWTASPHLQQFFNEENFKPHRESGRFTQFTTAMPERHPEESAAQYRKRLTRMRENQKILASLFGGDTPSSELPIVPSEEHSTHTQEVIQSMDGNDESNDHRSGTEDTSESSDATHDDSPDSGEPRESSSET